jgi:hypothetical protein
MAMRLKPALLIVCILALAIAMSCGSDSPTGTGGEKYSRETPEDVLLALSFAMANEDIDVYDECLSDDFMFGFVTQDCVDAGIPEADPWWGRADDMASTDSMFSHPMVTKIEADFPVNSSSSSGNERTFRCEPTIKVTVEPGGGGEPTTYWVFSSWLHVKLIKDEADTNLWQISEIREELKEAKSMEGVLATEPSTFGGIKAMFRPLGECEIAPRSTPECLIESFEWAMMTKDIGAYDECLSDMYLFTFTSEDADLIGLPVDEPWWGKTPEVHSIGNLFAAGNVTAIWCDLAIVNGPWATEGGVMYRLEPDIRVTVSDGGGGEPTTYWVHGSWLDVEIVPDPYSPEQWVFHSMAETIKAPYAVAGGKSTFGSIKAMYR